MSILERVRAIYVLAGSVVPFPQRPDYEFKIPEQELNSTEPLTDEGLSAIVEEVNRVNALLDEVDEEDIIINLHGYLTRLENRVIKSLKTLQRQRMRLVK